MRVKVRISSIRIPSIVLVVALSGIFSFLSQKDIVKSTSLAIYKLQEISWSANTLQQPPNLVGATCGNFVRPSLAVENMFDVLANNPETPSKSRFKYNPMNHGKFLDERLFKKQACMYDVLVRWNRLPKDLGITTWVAHGGTAMGAKCFGAMNPWDDDIDITVRNCTAFNALWENGERNVSQYHPEIDWNSHSMSNRAAIWDARLIGNGLILTKGSRCCDWYKLMTVQEASMWEDGMHIGGMDIECMDWKTSDREKQPMQASGWRTHMLEGNEVHTVPFGPTTIQIMEPEILNSHTELRYGKRSPCQFPFSNGGSPEKSRFKVQGNSSDIYQADQIQSQMDFVLENWYIPKSQRDEWLQQKGNGRQMEYTKQISNLDKIEIDNSISKGCTFGQGIKVIGWNAERGTHWEKFYDLIQEMEELKEPYVILMNEMDIGMARSGNVHTSRRLALELGMNYAFGVEFVELTPGTEEEHKATVGSRDALSLHGNAILSKCIIGDATILRDPLPHTYFSDRPRRGINANGFEVRLGGRMGIFARIFEEPNDLIPGRYNPPNGTYYTPSNLPPHYVVGNVHKVAENEQNRNTLWNYYGFGPPNSTGTIYEGKGVDLAPSQQGVVIQGDFGPQFCSLGGLGKMNNHRIHKTFRVTCLPDRKFDISPLSGDFFCSNMKASRDVKVTAPCDWSNNTNPLTLADHAIVSIVLQSNKVE